MARAARPGPQLAQRPWIRGAVFLLALLPLARIVWLGMNGRLGANPIETLTRASGDWTLYFLCVTLAMTPLRQLTGQSGWLKLRRMLGLFCFFYACLHFLCFLWFDHFFDIAEMAKDVLKRPFITVGFVAFVLMIPLAASSNSFAIRRLGGRQWQSLHRSSYAIAILAVVHFWWLVKADLLEPTIYALILAALLGARAWWRELERRRQLSMPPPARHLERPVIRIVPKGPDATGR